MRMLLILACVHGLFAIIRACGNRLIPWNPQRVARIIGGEVPPFGAVPWQVAVRAEGKHRCGGSIISPRLVLTAAHCVTDQMTVASNIHTVFEQNLRVQRVIQHNEFRKNGPYSNDIALLLLEQPGFTYNALVQPICLASATPTTGSWCEVSGWGTVDPLNLNQLSPLLRSATVPLLSLEDCRAERIYGGRQQSILDTMLCAGRLKGGVDACGGDSGGPLVCRAGSHMELVGIVSWGDGCAKRDRPGVYTRVASYAKWIRNSAKAMNVELD